MSRADDLVSRMGRSLRVPALGLGAGVAVATVALVRERTRTGREQSARRRADVLARAGELLGAPPGIDALLEQVAGLLVPDLGDAAIIDLLDAEGRLEAVTVRARDPDLEARVRAQRRSYPLDPDGPHPAAQALCSREAALLAAIPDEQLVRIAKDERHLALMRSAHYRSAMVLPLVARGRAFGVVSSLRIQRGGRYDADDLRLGRDLTARVALALDNARLFDELRVTERRLDAIVSNLGEAVVALAPDGTFVFANRAAARTAATGSVAALMNARVEDVFAPFDLLDDEGRPVSEPELPHARALRGEDPEPLVVQAVNRETGLSRWHVYRAQRVQGREGPLVVVVVEDVTAIKRQEVAQRLLAEASKLLTSSLDVGSTLERAAWAAVPELADWVRVALLDDRGDLVEAAVAHRDAARLNGLRARRARAPQDGETPAGPAAVVQTGVAELVEEVGAHDGSAAAAGDGETRSLLIVPLVAGEQIVGTMELATTALSGRRLTRADVPLAEELGRRAAIAVENARVHAERTHVAMTLQHSLLPPRLPEVPGLTIAARFRAAGTTSEVGGDFYDLFPARSGWMVVMGDVTGKGPGAAAITSLARHTMRTAAAYEDDPRRIVERLNATLVDDPERRKICTAVCMAVRRDEERMRLEVTCAGHPAPLLVTRDGSGVRPVGAPGTLLGAFPTGQWTREVVELGPGDAVVLYTDGVTDTRGPEGRFGSARLRELLTRVGPREADEIAVAIDDALRDFGEQRDDVALLVLRAEPTS